MITSSFSNAGAVPPISFLTGACQSR